MNSRYWMMLRSALIRSPMKRAAWLKAHGAFHHCGDRVMITSRKLPLYSQLIGIGENVWLAAGVSFITHDVNHYMFNGIRKRKDGTNFEEKIGCINIGDNVFIGADVKIMYDVNIGNNVVIAAGAVVTKDIPDNTVAAGIPAKPIGHVDDLMEKRESYHNEHKPDNANQHVSPECVAEQWERFYAMHKEASKND